MRFMGILCMLGVGVAAAAADHSPKQSFSSGTWASETPSRVQVKIHPAGKGVDVIVNKDKDQLPLSLGITFFNAEGKPTSIELKTIDASRDASLYHGNWEAMPESLSPNAQSFVGFEIRIPFGFKPVKVLRSEFMEKKD